jgi:hypothetical protein
VSMRAKFSQKAADGMVFSPDLFAAQIGREVPITGTEMTAKIMDAVVSEDGSEVVLTLELPDDFPAPGVNPPGSFSLWTED